jgi:prepilin-type processing-associated H-X9-DG protein
MQYVRHSRPGSSWVELLVFIFIVCVLISFFISKTCGLREAAVRIQCGNNLKQVCLAVQNYHDTFGKYPQGTIPSAVLPPEKRLSWFVSLIPFLEFPDGRISPDKDRAWDAGNNRLLSDVEWKLLICPAAQAAARSPGWGFTSYIGMAGVGADAAMLPVEDKRAGFFGYDRVIRHKDIKDGLTNTMMVIESTSVGPWTAGGQSTVRGLDPDTRPYLATNGPFGLIHRADTIFHSNTVMSNIGFADGSVRNVLASVSPETLEALATIAGGDTPGDDY